eukprot:TRINITY_DN34809_c0_g2_i1.p1 TRINITY_DN34809_c0_g2~~TRINITY_DN34809_c0_g2_i1.p1  ORF type:complete len:380 (+),score=39.17 TRINITY_DN34809_c0_g2_i1:170-1141(+)
MPAREAGFRAGEAHACEGSPFKDATFEDENLSDANPNFPERGDVEMQEQGRWARRRGEANVESRQHSIESALQGLHRAQNIVARLRFSLRQCGPGAVLSLRRQLCAIAAADAQRGRVALTIDASILQRALSQLGVGVSLAEVTALLEDMDFAGLGAVDLNDWLQLLSGPLDQRRAALVSVVFRGLDIGMHGSLDVSELREHLHRVAIGNRRRGNQPAIEGLLEDPLQDILLDNGSRDPTLSGSPRRNSRFVSWDDFRRYYEFVSAGVESDRYFDYLVRATWGIESSPHAHYAENSRRSHDSNIQSTAGGLCGQELKGRQIGAW